MKSKNIEYKSSLLKTQKNLLQLILMLILLGLIITGAVFFYYYQNIVRLNALTANLKEREYQLQTLQFMKETMPALKGSIANSKSRFYTPKEADYFQKGLVDLLNPMGLTITNMNIDPLEAVDSQLATQRLRLSLKGSFASCLTFLNYLEQRLSQEVVVYSLSMSADRGVYFIHLVLLFPLMR